PHDVVAGVATAFLLSDTTLERLHAVIPLLDPLAGVLPCAVRSVVGRTHGARRGLVAGSAEAGDAAAHLVRRVGKPLSVTHRLARGFEPTLRVGELRFHLVERHAAYPQPDRLSSTYRSHAPMSTRWNSSLRPCMAAYLFSVVYFTPSCCAASSGCTPP